MKSIGPVRFGAARTERTPLRLVYSRNDNHFNLRAFELDRQLVVRSLKTLTAEIERAAIDLEMVLAESVFDRPVSMELLQEARRLRSMAYELKKLRTNVGRPRAIR